jgi:hypothetical protein
MSKTYLITVTDEDAAWIDELRATRSRWAPDGGRLFITGCVPALNMSAPVEIEEADEPEPAPPADPDHAYRASYRDGDPPDTEPDKPAEPRKGDDGLAGWARIIARMRTAPEPGCAYTDTDWTAGR